jgi:hypothetical protein
MYNNGGISEQLAFFALFGVSKLQISLGRRMYIVYHEMLHLRHPVKMRGSRRCVHGKEFRADENAFPQIEEAKRMLKGL